MNNQPDTSLGCTSSGNSTSLASLIDQLQGELANEHGTLLRDVPVEDYIAGLRSYPEIAGLGYRSDFISRLCRQIRERAGVAALPRYARPRNPYTERSGATASDRIEQLFQQNFHRIANALASGTEPLDFYGYTNSHFRKDIALCALRLIPVGARKIHVHGIARRAHSAGRSTRVGTSRFPAMALGRRLQTAVRMAYRHSRPRCHGRVQSARLGTLLPAHSPVAPVTPRISAARSAQAGSTIPNWRK